MTWLERLNGGKAPMALRARRAAPSSAQRLARGPAQTPAAGAAPWFRPARLDGLAVAHWFDETRPDMLAHFRDRADFARHARPKDPLAHAAYAVALVAAVRAGVTDDVDEDAIAARAAAQTALELAPHESLIMALTAPAFVHDDPYRAADLLKAATQNLKMPLPESLLYAARDGARRPPTG